VTPVRPVGRITRGTTGRRRLRRVDRWLLAAHPRLVAVPDLLVVDLGFGASPVTTLDLAARLQRVNPTASVVGLDIDPVRVAAAAGAGEPRVRFATGGFELAGLQPHIVRALNVLRQYDEADVAPAWERMCTQLRPGGLLVEGTCDELGRWGSWVSVDRSGPRSLTLAVDLSAPPAAVAARLPKLLIARNVPGEPVHRLLSGLDDAWRRHAGIGAVAPRQRFAAAVADLRHAGVPVLDGPRRWRRGEVTVAWSAVASRGR
jgi:SAM-dependent methyltransferase